MSDSLSGPVTCAWLTYTPDSPTVTLIVLASFNGVAKNPFVKSVLNTVEPNTWYVKISPNSSEANNSSAVIFNASSTTAKASSVGANTVKVPEPLKVASNPAASIAAVKVVCSGLAAMKS